MRSQPPSGSRPLYLYVDESGNFDFSDKGTSHFVMAGILTPNPLSNLLNMQSVRYELLQEGRDIQFFHATQDKQFVRDKVLHAFQLMQDVHAFVIYCKKSKFPEAMQSEPKIHALFARCLIEAAGQTIRRLDPSQVIMIFDHTLHGKKRKEFLALLKPVLKELGPFLLFFHSMKSDMNGQIADYVAWGKFKQLERFEPRPWNSLRRSLNPLEREVTGIHDF